MQADLDRSNNESCADIYIIGVASRPYFPIHRPVTFFNDAEPQSPAWTGGIIRIQVNLTGLVSKAKMDELRRAESGETVRRR
jgi:hypothetical protein